MLQKARHVVYMTLLMVVSLVIIFQPDAMAQPRENPIERARHHMELGQDAFGQGDFETAITHFIDAYAASPFPAFIYNAGFAAEKNADNAKAARFYRQYLNEEPNSPDAAQVELRIRALLAETATQTIEGEESPGVPLQVEISETEMKSLISVRTNPPDAKIRILDEKGNQVSSFEGPSGQTVTGGTYTIEASHPDYRTVQTNISITSSQVYIVVVEMSQGAFLGFVHVTTDVPGAAVYIDNKIDGKVGDTPWGNVLQTGKHKIWIEKPGYNPIEKEIEINIGDNQELEFTLERLSFGMLFLKSNINGAQVFVDKQLIGLASSKNPLNKQINAGIHQIRISYKGMKDYKTEITIHKGQTTKLLVRLNPKPSRTSAWVSTGFATTLFVGGSILGVKALRKHRALDDLRNDGLLSDGDPRILNSFLLGLGSDVAFGVGAIVSGLALYYFVRDPLPESEGKLFDSEDFGENPDIDSSNEKETLSATPVVVNNNPKFMITPLISPSTTGLGLAITF